MTTDHAHIEDGVKLAAAAAAAVIIGSMVLIGWAFDIAVLKSILPGWISMKPNTAVCFILSGIALWLTARQQSAIFLARLFGLLAGLIGLLTLGEFIFGWNLGIDQWLIHEPVGTLSTAHPIRMAPEAAMNFVLLSVALWLTGGSRQTHTSSRARWSLIASVSLGLVVVTLALAALLSHLTPGFGAYGWFGLALMAVHAAILFALLGMAVIAISWQPEVLSWSLSRRTTAAIACSMALLVFVGLNTSRSQFWMIETNRQIAHTEKMLVDADNVLAGIIDAQVHSRDYLITGDEQYLKLYLSAKADSLAKLDELYRTEFASAEAEHQQHFTQTEAQVKAQFQLLQQIIDARRNGINEVTRNNMFSHGEELLGKFRSTLAQIESEDRQIIEQLKRESKSVARFSYLSIFIGTLASLLIFLAVIFRLNSAMNMRKQANERYRNIIQTSMDCFWHVDTEGRILNVNDAYCQLSGYTREELLNMHIPDVEAKETSGDTAQHIHTILTKGYDRFDTQHRHKDGQLLDMEVSVVYQQDTEGRHLFAFLHDITWRKQAEEKIRNLALHDTLTQLPNRRLLNDRLEQTMAASKRSGRYSVLIFLDLDNFKPLNDTHGHGVGDLLLIEAARRITGCVREMDTCARFGGDEFVVILSELDTDQAESTAQAGIVAEKIRAILSEPYVLTIQQEDKAGTTVEHHCTSSIGMVLFINHEGSPEDILKWADMAMYQAKEAGRNSIRFYESTGE